MKEAERRAVESACRPELAGDATLSQVLDHVKPEQVVRLFQKAAQEELGAVAARLAHGGRGGKHKPSPVALTAALRAWEWGMDWRAEARAEAEAEKTARTVAYAQRLLARRGVRVELAVEPKGAGEAKAEGASNE